jgi:cytochrome c oxidase subunit 1
MMSDTLGRIHFIGTLITLNIIFAPMFIQGLAGVNRRLWDAGTIYSHAQGTLYLNVPMAHAALMLALFQIPFLFNLFWSIKRGRVAQENPWQATTLEWAAPTPPPHGNFPHPVRAYRDPYDYSVPGAAADFTPQNAASTDGAA